MTGTGRAITSTPDKEHTPPTTFPVMVLGTMSPYLKAERERDDGDLTDWMVLAAAEQTCVFKN